MIIVVPSCLKDADGARTRSDQNCQIDSWTLKNTYQIFHNAKFADYLIFMNLIFHFQNRIDPNWTDEEKAFHEQQRIKKLTFKVIMLNP
jgi:hypothetical protein